MYRLLAGIDVSKDFFSAAALDRKKSFSRRIGLFD
jgi:hypothetical protein